MSLLSDAYPDRIQYLVCPELAWGQDMEMASFSGASSTLLSYFLLLHPLLIFIHCELTEICSFQGIWFECFLFSLLGGIWEERGEEQSLQGLMLNTGAPILWPPDANSWLTGKDPDAGKDWTQEEKEAAENEMVRRHHQLNVYESEQTLGNSEGQGSLSCCSPQGSRELDTT